MLLLGNTAPFGSPAERSARAQSSRAQSSRAQRLTVAALTLALIFVAGPALSQSPGQSFLGEAFVETKSTTIGPNGELFHIQAGTHLDLFPEDPAAGWNIILALDVVREGQLSERLVIPGTEGFEIESEATLIADGDQLFILWMSRAENNLSNLELVSFDAASSSWSAKVDVSGDPLPLKGPPALAATRESLSLPAILNENGEEVAPAIETTRTVVHLLWWEEPEPQETSLFYTPIVLADGEFLGWNPVVEFDQTFFQTAAPGAVATTEFSPTLIRAASIARGTDQRSVVLGLPESETGRLFNMVVRLLPGGLAAIAEDARSHIVGVGLIQTPADPGNNGGPDYMGIAENARSHIVGVGRALHLGIREYIAAQVAVRVLEFGQATGSNPDIEDLADAVWSEVMDSGASLLGNQLRSEDLSCGVLHLGELAMATPGEEAVESVHQVEFCIGSEHALPETSEALGAEYRIVTSEDGARALIVWQEDDSSVHYRRTEEGGWTDSQPVPDASLGLDEATALLRSQVRIR